MQTFRFWILNPSKSLQYATLLILSTHLMIAKKSVPFFLNLKFKVAIDEVPICS